MDKQRKELAAGAEVVVATPGRLIDLVGRGDIDLSNVRFLVLDEADRMCDMGFLPNVEWILRHMPKDRQTMLFSATLGSDVNYMIKNELTDPVRHTIESDTTTVDSSRHHFLHVHEMDRVKVVRSIVDSFDRALVFLNTKRGCDRLVDDLKDVGVQARVIHGDLDQTRRDRALRQFSEGQIHVLVATDVAARGLHIDGVDVVVQFDPPDDHKTYLHRAGRTARAGATGCCRHLGAVESEAGNRPPAEATRPLHSGVRGVLEQSDPHEARHLGCDRSRSVRITRPTAEADRSICSGVERATLGRY